jgi:hypothetical protein
LAQIGFLFAVVETVTPFPSSYGTANVTAKDVSRWATLTLAPLSGFFASSQHPSSISST